MHHPIKDDLTWKSRLGWVAARAEKLLCIPGLTDCFMEIRENASSYFNLQGGRLFVGFLTGKAAA